MRLILSFMVFALFGFVQQSCQKEEMTTNKTQEVAKANTNSAVANSRTATRSGAPAETAAAHSDDADAARISLADAKKSFDANDAVFVDTRAESAFKVEHIKGAINIPAEGFQSRSGEVPKDKRIIAYCS